MRKKKFYLIFLVLLILTAIALAFKKVFERLDEKVEKLDTDKIPLQPSILYVPNSDSSLLSRISELESLTEISLLALDNIDFGQVVSISNGNAFLFDLTKSEFYNFPVGIAKSSSLGGHTVKVALSGKLTGFSELVPNMRYYAGANGNIVPDAPLNGVLQPIGYAVDSHTLLINISNKIHL